MSVICPAYNHEQYIGKLIHSILNQTEQDFEAIIVDDCSKDRTPEVVESFADDRIKLIRNKFNRGLNANINTALEAATGDFLTYIGSDDMFFNTHFEVMTKYLEQHPDTDVVYCWLQPIDENGNKHPYYDDSAPFSSAREEALREMFYKRSVFPCPGMTMRRSALQKICPLPPAVANYQDCMMHIWLLMNGDFHQLPEPLVYYRRHEGNLSANDLIPFTRSRYEISALMDAFLKMSADQIRQVFPAELNDLKLTVTDENKSFVLGMLALRADDECRRLWGYSQIIDAVNKNERELHDTCGYDYKFLLGLTGEIVNRFHQIELHKNERGWFEKFFYRMYRHLEKKRMKRTRR